MEDKTFALLEKMYAEFLGFKEEMTGFKKDMLDFKEDMTGFKGNMVSFREDMTGFKGDMLSFKEETRSGFRRIENKIDGEITPKLDALFDGYKANSQLLEELNDKTDNLQVDVNNLSIKVVNNDNRIIEIKRNLRSVK